MFIHLSWRLLDIHSVILETSRYLSFHPGDCQKFIHSSRRLLDFHSFISKTSRYSFIHPGYFYIFIHSSGDFQIFIHPSWETYRYSVLRAGDFQICIHPGDFQILIQPSRSRFDIHFLRRLYLFIYSGDFQKILNIYFSYRLFQFLFIRFINIET